MTSLSTSQINVRKFKYQKLSSKDDVKKLKEKLISNVSDYLDDLLQDFVLKEKEMKKNYTDYILKISPIGEAVLYTRIVI